jgi:putative DNA primase/helicase
MRFEDFARAHGLLFSNVTPGRWMATPTEDHPHKKNGRYKFLGDVGWVQNWATMQSPAIWRPEKNEPAKRLVRVFDDDKHRRQLAEKAATKAAWIMHQARQERHPYLEKKGFPEQVGNVWEQDGKRLLVIPMRVGTKLVGCQLIDEEGGKKFLYGQTSKGACFTIDAKGIPIFCEGFATGLSIRTVMKAMKVRYVVHICFSASNLKDVSGRVPGGIVVADNDPNGVGEQAALVTGKPYWISDTGGEDFNDYHNRVGLFKASQSLKKVVFSGGAA